MYEKSCPIGAGFFVFGGFFFILEELQLLAWRIGLDMFFADKQLYFGELLVGDGQATYLSELWQGCFDAFEVYGGILAAGTVAHVDGELEHREAVAQQMFAEVGSGLPFAFGVGGEVEEDKEPHDAVFAETVHCATFRGKLCGGFLRRSIGQGRLLLCWLPPSGGCVGQRCALQGWEW